MIINKGQYRSMLSVKRHKKRKMIVPRLMDFEASYGFYVSNRKPERSNSWRKRTVLTVEANRHAINLSRSAAFSFCSWLPPAASGYPLYYLHHSILGVVVQVLVVE
jgi:hypothetical protein